MNVEHLVIRLHDDTDAAQWAVFDDNGRVVHKVQSGPLAAAVPAAAGRRTIVLVPGVDVVMSEAALPKASPARLRKMLPFALEDALAEDVENLFFAVGPRLESGELAVAVVSQPLLEDWLERLSAAGLSPHAIHPDAEGVPDTPSTLTLVIEDGRVYGRVPGRPPFVFDGLTLEQVVAVADHAGELKHAVIYVDEPGRARFSDDLRAVGERIASTQVKLMGDGALYRLAATLTARPGTNLLQGRFAPKSNVGVYLRPWRAAAGLLVGLVLLSMVAQAAEYFSLRQQDRALTARLAESCREELSASTLAACETAVRGRLGRSGLLGTNDSGFLLALATVAEARAPQSRISGLNYRNGVMDLQLLVPDVPALDAFAREVERSERFEVRIEFTNPREEGIEGRVQLIAVEERR